MSVFTPRGVAATSMSLGLCVAAAGIRPDLAGPDPRASLFWNGFAGLSLAVFTKMTPPPGSAGGLLNAIVGSLIMTVIGVAIGTPLGMLAGTYLAEYGRIRALAVVVRFINDILLSAPSIVDRPVRLRDRRRADGPFLRLAGGDGAGGARRSGGGAHHRGHAATWCPTPCARRRRRWACRARW